MTSFENNIDFFDLLGDVEKMNEEIRDFTLRKVIEKARKIKKNRFNISKEKIEKLIKVENNKKRLRQKEYSLSVYSHPHHTLFVYYIIMRRCPQNN